MERRELSAFGREVVFVTALVLGVGSPFGDDRLGWVLVERLRASGFPARVPEVRFETADRPGALLLAALEGVEEAILVDAVEGGLAPGEIVRLEGTAVEGRAESLFSSHGLGVGPALQLGRALGQLPPRLILYGIQLSTVPFAETVDAPLSVAVADAIDLLLPMIERDLSGFA
ncbi:hydrogenase maturation protease [Endothiovibrio diazotrophicus]